MCFSRICPWFLFCRTKAHLFGKLCIKNSSLFLHAAASFHFSDRSLASTDQTPRYVRWPPKRPTSFCATFSSGHPKPESAFPLFLFFPWELAGMAQKHSVHISIDSGKWSQIKYCNQRTHVSLTDIFNDHCIVHRYVHC